MAMEAEKASRVGLECESLGLTAEWTEQAHEGFAKRDENHSYVLETADVDIGTAHFKFSWIVLEKALWTFLVNENVYFSYSLQSIPLYSACAWSVSTLPMLLHVKPRRTFEMFWSCLRTLQGFLSNSPDPAFSPMAHPSKQASCKFHLDKKGRTSFQFQ